MKTLCPYCYSDDVGERIDICVDHKRYNLDGWTVHRCWSCKSVFVDGITVSGERVLIYLGKCEVPEECEICHTKKDVKMWINPSNKSDRGYYCPKHSPQKSFEKFEELVQLQKVIK